MQKVEVKGMSCAHCVAAVKEALEDLGLTGVQVSLEAGSASFDPAEIDPAAVTAAIDDAGFEVGQMS